MTRDEVTIGSLFAGIGGLELGLEWALREHGYAPRVAFQVEREPFCREILARHWPDAVRHDDVRTVGAHNLPRVDVLCGGFPCTDLSVAGKGAGLAGANSGLWFQYARLVGELRPRCVVVENVPPLVAVLGDVLGPLAALGYDAWWDRVSAADVGAPHERERVFVVAWHRMADAPRDLRVTPRNDVSSPSDRTGDRVRPRWGAVRIVDRGADGLPARLDGTRWPRGRGPEQHGWEPPRTTPKEAHRGARLKALGNAVVPQVAYVVGCALVALMDVT